MNMYRDKIIKMLVILALLCLGVWALTTVHRKNSMTLQEYAQLHPELAYKPSDPAMEKNVDDTSEGSESVQNSEINSFISNNTENNSVSNLTDNLQEQNTASTSTTDSTLTGAKLNGVNMIEQRVTYADAFYYEPLSEDLKRYITGVSFPANAQNTENPPAVSYEDLCYLHLLHYDFDGNPTEGELICNVDIAQDLVEIFYELYLNEYRLQSVHLIDEYDGDDVASMEANNTSCFNYRVVEGSTSLSKHALGLAIDINPLYNPYITYEKDGSEKISPSAAADYADRSANFPYKIDESDLCYKLFIQHGFTWGGNWNSCKDYQHFQKPLH